MSARDTTAQLMRALAERHDDGWAFFTEVPAPGVDADGRPTERRADALAFSFWQSRGHDFHGYEVKATRSDWRRELDDPAKAEALARWCAYWWVVAAPDVVRRDEVPAGWGLMTPGSNGKLRIRKRAPRQHAEPPTMRLFATLLKKALTGRPSAEQSRALVDRAYERGIEDGKRRGRHEAGEAPRELARLRERLEAFTEASGIDIGAGWGTESARALGVAAHLVASGELPEYARRLRWMSEHARHTAERIAEHRADVDRALEAVAALDPSAG